MFVFKDNIGEDVREGLKSMFLGLADGNDNEYEVGSKMEFEVELEGNNESNFPVLAYLDNWRSVNFKYKGIDIKVKQISDGEDDEFIYCKVTWVEPDWSEVDNKFLVD